LAEVDDLIGDATVDGTAGNTITDRISTALSDLVGSAPEALNTLEELAAALGDDADFATTVVNALAAQNELSEMEDVNISQPVDGETLVYDNGDWVNQFIDVDAPVSAHNSETTNVHGISDTSLLETQSGAQDKANAAQSSAEDYADSLSVNYDAAGSAATAETNSKAYTDDLIGDGTVDGTTGNTVTDRIDSAVSGLVGAAPELLNTLEELAAALNDDENFATTVENQIASKAPLASPTFTGTVDFSNATVQGLEIPQPLHPFSMIG
jgi:hypothetical protein